MNYGGRGICMCNEWFQDYEKFKEFVSALEHYGEPGYTLDRIDNDGWYEPGNVRWATQNEQKSNTRRNHVLLYNGEERTLTELANINGINPCTLYARVSKLGYSVEDALNIPVKNHGSRYSLNGKSHTISEWSKITGMSLSTLQSRLKAGWTVERMITEPAIPRKKIAMNTQAAK